MRSFISRTIQIQNVVFTCFFFPFILLSNSPLLFSHPKASVDNGSQTPFLENEKVIPRLRILSEQ